MTHPSEPLPETIRFVVPRSLQQFDLFWKLPYDIRHMIWECVIFTPGIHFLKFVETVDTPAVHTHVFTGPNSGLSTTLPERRIENMQDAETFFHTATLKPVYPLACADNSYYIVLNKTLTLLRDSYDEAADLVEKVLAQPGNLTLANGQLAMLQRSSDVVCIDYPNMAHGRHLGRWAEHLQLDQLAKIRRLAVRYHHGWDSQEMVCGYCGRVHSYHGKNPSPRHVYEFAALFKNLEDFYFIDCLTVRSSSRPSHCSGEEQKFDAPRQRLASGEDGRSYFEVDPNNHRMHTRVHETLSWLRNNYIAHCMCKSQGPAQPEKVRFGILGCEWEADQKLAPSKRLEPLRSSTRRKISKRQASSFTSYSRSSSVVSHGPPSQPVDSNTLPIVFGDARKSNFNFSLQIPH